MNKIKLDKEHYINFSLQNIVGDDAKPKLPIYSDFIPLALACWILNNCNEDRASEVILYFLNKSITDAMLQDALSKLINSNSSGSAYCMFRLISEFLERGTNITDVLKGEYKNITIHINKQKFSLELATNSKEHIDALWIFLKKAMNIDGNSTFLYLLIFKVDLNRINSFTCADNLKEYILTSFNDILSPMLSLEYLLPVQKEEEQSSVTMAHS